MNIQVIYIFGYKSMKTLLFQKINIIRLSKRMIRWNVDIDGELRNFHIVVATVSIQFTRKLSKYLNIYEMFCIHSVFYSRKKKNVFCLSVLSYFISIHGHLT